MATITSIVYQPKDQEYEEGRFSDFIRVPVEAAELIANHGIKDDRKSGKNPKRQLNLLSETWLAKKKDEGYLVEPGQFGEQLIVEGMELETLKQGAILQLGEQACIEITKSRDGCERLEAAQGVAGLANTSIGMLARVLVGGTIRVGDAVKLLEDDA